MEDKTYTHIFNELYSKVLQLSEKPSQFAEYLTLQIREFIGSRTVVIAVKTETGQTDIFSVYPQRRIEWANQSAVIKLAELSFNYSTVQYLDKEKHNNDYSGLLIHLEIEKAIAIPLIIGNNNIGSILLLDIMDDFGIEAVIKLLDKLSGVFALIIKNSYLYYEMENLVAIRTAELQDQNKMLLKREKDLQSLNEEYQVINKELTVALNNADIINNELIAAKEKAEESDRLKSAFLANMSHEIRTPMNGILGFTELLLEPDLTSEQKETYINIVNQSGQRMLNTVNDIVEISKIEAGIISINLVEVDVQKGLVELIRFFTPEATKKGLKLILEYEAPKSVSVITTDQNKFDSILTNLIKNAIKFTLNGEIRVGCKVKANKLEFYVKDTGIGIPADRQKAIFERFIQADILDLDARQGSGLGLAISKAYVEMLGGEIFVESKTGEGSLFFFTLPLNKQFQDKKVESITYNMEGKTKKIKGLNVLIAEDDEISAIYLTTIIKNESETIVIAKTGVETVEACRNNPEIDLVLMDIQMPGMNGYEASREIRKFNKKVVIIVQTAFALMSDREKALEAGCNNYIAKPILKKELLELLQKYFG